MRIVRFCRSMPHRVADPQGKVSHELRTGLIGAVSDHPGRDEFGVFADRYPGPHITGVTVLGCQRGAAFGVDERPKLVGL